MDSHDNYIHPKRPYSFEAMLADLLDFATTHLVDDGRLSFWMPTANDEDVYLAIPTHPSLDLVSVCVQPFNKCLSSYAEKHCTIAFPFANPIDQGPEDFSHIDDFPMPAPEKM